MHINGNTGFKYVLMHMVMPTEQVFIPDTETIPGGGCFVQIDIKHFFNIIYRYMPKKTFILVSNEMLVIALKC